MFDSLNCNLRFLLHSISLSNSIITIYTKQGFYLAHFLIKSLIIIKFYKLRNISMYSKMSELTPHN